MAEPKGEGLVIVNQKEVSWQNRVKTLEEQINQLLAGKEFWWKDMDRLLWQNIPGKPGVYMVIEGDRCIYVGQSENLRRRLKTHGRGNVGGDTFHKKLRKIRHIEEKKDRMKFVKDRCFFKFLEAKKGKGLDNLEHFTIAVLDPELND